MLMWYWIFHYCVGRSCGHLLTHVCVFSLLCLSTVFSGASSFVKNKINIRDLASWDVKKVKQMASMLSSSSAEAGSLCGRDWVESPASSKPGQVPTSTADICAPCSSIEAASVKNFCSDNGNHGLIVRASSTMCKKDPCLKTSDASTCCACAHDDGTTANEAPCACGTSHGSPPSFCGANEYCNAASRLCAAHQIPTCPNSGGLLENPSSCACESAA